jgi:hypothetical protein
MPVWLSVNVYFPLAAEPFRQPRIELPLALFAPAWLLGAGWPLVAAPLWLLGLAVP